MLSFCPGSIAKEVKVPPTGPTGIGSSVRISGKKVVKLAVVGIDWLKTALVRIADAIRLIRNAKKISPPTLNRRVKGLRKNLRMFPRSLHCNSRAREKSTILAKYFLKSVQGDFDGLIRDVVVRHHAVFRGTRIHQ